MTERRRKQSYEGEQFQGQRGTRGSGGERGRSRGEGGQGYRNQQGYGGQGGQQGYGGRHQQDSAPGRHQGYDSEESYGGYGQRYGQETYGSEGGFRGQGRQTGEMGEHGYEREFYGADEGSGSGAGSRRYSEIDQGYMGGEYTGGEYGADRSQRDFGGAPLLDPEFTSSSGGGQYGGQFGGTYGGGYGGPSSGYGSTSHPGGSQGRWQGGGAYQRGEAGQGAGRGGWGGNYGSSYGQSGQQGGSWSPGRSTESGMQRGSYRESPDVRFGMHAPWELGPRGSGSESGRFGGGYTERMGWQEGASGSYGRGGGRSSQYGRGPKGYTRSDERLTEEINEQLMRDPDIDASDIEVKVERGVVTLGGSVQERRLKHEIEDLVSGVMGVKDVTNQLRVQHDRSNGESSSDGDRGETVSSSGRQSISSATSAASSSSKRDRDR